ncbi:hypothetical protein BGAL_0381g00110 [Botrytis galanthina]|uniref:Uncharacterized protein n=1 Tax=Botrytis galanthina TaxID=278940 RepID=A0A4S8R092_9HELO|nr:hypothetical protein BGAL_0381g00110 [Botrytis galanthina]
MLIFILVWGLLSGLAASTTPTDINANFFYLTFDPNATITTFQSIQVVSGSSNALVIPGNVQAVWPALQNNQGIMQTVVANQGNIGEWFYIGLEFCCTPEDWQADKAQQDSGADEYTVYPGDRITTKYQLMSANTGVYNVTWKVERGQSGIQAGETSFTAESSFDPQAHCSFAIKSQCPRSRVANEDDQQQPLVAKARLIRYSSQLKHKEEADTTRSDWCFKPTNNTDFQHYLSTPTAFVSDNQVICEYSSLILGDIKPHTALSSLETISHTEPGPTTQDLVFSPTTSPTAAVFVYRREPPLPTPSLDGPGNAPTSTLSNGLPDPSYSALSASWKLSNDYYSSYNSVQISKYTVALEADLKSVFGTTTITTVDGDSALTTITTDNYQAWATAYAAAHGNGTGNSTIADADQDPVHLIPMSLPWLMGMLVIMSSVIVGAAAFFIYRPRQREVL